MRRAAVIIARIAIIAFFAVVDDAVTAVNHAARIRTLARRIGAVGESFGFCREDPAIALFITIDAPITAVGIFTIVAIGIGDIRNTDARR